MKLKDLHTAVQRRADTAGTKIGAADVSRVISETFCVLAGLCPHELADVLCRGLTQAAKRTAAPAPKRKR